MPSAANSLKAAVARWLRPIRFEDPKLERQFLRSDCTSTLPLARFCYSSAVFIWAGFGLLDAVVGGNSTGKLWTIRFGVGEPTILFALAATYLRPLRPWLKTVGLTVTFVLGACVIWMMLVLGPPASHTYYVGIILVLFPAYVFAQVRFWHAVVVSLVLVAGYRWLALPNPFTSPSVAATNLTFMITTIYIGLVACLLLERARRRDFAQLGEIERTTRELERLSTHDDLTKLHNRRRLEPALAEAIQSVQHTGRSYALLMIDLDDFKKVNDRHGHGIGDRVLIEAATAITSHLGDHDVAFRIGGDEFVVLLPDSSVTTAASLATAIDRTFAERVASLSCGSILAVGMSIGVAELPRNTETPTELLRQADEALYQAKLRGKGQVVAVRRSGRTTADLEVASSGT